MSVHDMGSCLSLMACESDEQNAAAADNCDEQLDGAQLSSTQPLVVNNIVYDGEMAAEAELPIVMPPNQVECIMNNFEYLVKCTSNVWVYRIAEELREAGIVLPKYELKGDCTKLSDEIVRQFYMDIQWAPYPNTLEEICKVCTKHKFHTINKLFLPLVPALLPTVKRQESEDPDAALGRRSPDSDNEYTVAEEELNKTTAMNEKQRNLIMNNIEALADNISNANFRDVVDSLSDVIPPEKLSYFKDDSIDLIQKIKHFFTTLTELNCPDPYKRVTCVFMRNERVRHILSQYYPKPSQASSYPSLQRPVNSGGARPTILTKTMRDINSEVNSAISQEKFEPDVQIFMETLHDLDIATESNSKRIKVKTAKKRMDLDANNKFNYKEMYKSGSNPKGFVLILNIFSYPHYDQHEKERNGSELDAAKLIKLFEELDFRVITFPSFITNLKDMVTEEMFKKAIQDFASNQGHYHTDIAFVVIMGHGEELSTSGRGNAIICSDNKSVPLTWIHSQFSSRDCPFLVGKPKVFIYQACRGSYVASSWANEYSPKRASALGNDFDGKGNIEETQALLKLPSGYERYLDDMLVCHAAPQGHVAHRDRNVGSVFIQTIVDVFVDMAHDTHVKRMMIEVDRRIKEKSNKTFSQTPTTESIGFDKKLYLHPHLFFDEYDYESEEDA